MGKCFKNGNFDYDILDIKGLINEQSPIKINLEDIYEKELLEKLFLSFLQYGISIIDNLNKDEINKKKKIEDVWIFNDTVVDFCKYKATVKGKDAEVRIIPLKILKVLLEHEGQALTRNQIIDKVWGRDAVLCDRVVDIHISALKRKLNLGISIESIRGIGYKFN
ncbi:winged helix-turn-helix domain-containing protein [Clostridioides difficile]